MEPQKDLFDNTRATLPNSTTVFVLGICPVIFSCFIIGLVLGIIGLYMSKEGRELYKYNPNVYDGYGLLNAGYILSIIGTVLGSLGTLYYVVIFLIAFNVR